jgi:hypothetical protein
VYLFSSLEIDPKIATAVFSLMENGIFKPESQVEIFFYPITLTRHECRLLSVKVRKNFFK